MGRPSAPKGPRVTLHRWFSWCSAQGFHDRVWHQRLLAILNIALGLGVYSNYSQVPYWGGPLATKKRPEAAPADQEPHLAGQAAAARLTQAAMGLSSEARSSTDAAPQEGTALMRTEDKSISQLRRVCGSTLWVVCAIPSRDNVQSLARLLKVFAQPVVDAHFDHERSARHLAAALHYYASSTAGSWLSTLQQAAALAQDATALSQAGFDTAFAAAPPALAWNSPSLQPEQSLAQTAIDFLLCLLANRGASLSWHTTTWPGALALLCTGKAEDTTRCLEALALDWQAFQQASALAP